MFEYATRVTVTDIVLHNKANGVNCVRVEIQTSEGLVDLGDRCHADAKEGTNVYPHTRGYYNLEHTNKRYEIKGFSPIDLPACAHTEARIANDALTSCACGRMRTVCSAHDAEAGAFCHAATSTCSVVPLAPCSENGPENIDARCICGGTVVCNAHDSSSGSFCHEGYSFASNLKNAADSRNGIPPTTTAPLIFGAGAFTVEAWVYSTKQTTPDQQPVFSTSGSSTDWHLSMELELGKTLWCVLRHSPSSSNHRVINSILIETNTWTHLACTRDHNGLVTAWVDGKTGTLPQVYGGGYDGSPSTHDIKGPDPRIGENPDDLTDFFPGKIRSFRAVKGLALYDNATVAAAAGALENANDEGGLDALPPAYLGSCPFGTIAGVDCLAMDNGAANVCRATAFHNVDYVEVEDSARCGNTVKKPLDDGDTYTEAECADAVANDGECGELFELKADGTSCRCMAPLETCYQREDANVKRFRVVLPRT
jgi:hypothetical protein